jgi:hypothetical protein
MGIGCMSRIEYKTTEEGPWKLLEERNESGEGYIVRGWWLYELLGVFDSDTEGEVKAMFRRRGLPDNMSEALDEHLLDEDEGVREKISWVTAEELRQLSEAWDKILRDCGDDPVTSSVTLRKRLFVAEKLLEPPNAAAKVRMVYWFS